MNYMYFEYTMDRQYIIKHTSGPEHVDLLKDMHAMAMREIAKRAWFTALKGINNHRDKIRVSVMEVLADARAATDVVANHVAGKVLGTKSIAPFLDMMSARLRPLAQAALNPLMACICETAESHAHGFSSLLQNGTAMDSAGLEDLLSFLCECICMSYVCHMTEIFFLTESVTGVDR